MSLIKRFFCCIFLLLSAFFSIAQKERTDSLISLLSSVKTDSGKAQLLNSIAWDLIQTSGDYSQAIERATEAIRLCKKERKKEKGVSFNILATAYLFLGDYSKAIKNYKTSLQIKSELNDKTGIASAFSNLGLVYMYQGNFTEALKHMESALKIETELNNRDDMAGSYNNIGIVYEDLGNYAAALSSYFTSLKIKEELSDKKGIANTLCNIGLIKGFQGDYTKALQYHERAFRLRVEIKDQRGVADCHNNLGNTYKELGYFHEALHQLEKALSIYREIGNKAGIASAHNNLGHLYFIAGSDLELGSTPGFLKALKHYNTALEINGEIKDEGGIASSLLNMGSASLRLKQYNNARQYLDSALAMSKKIGAKKTIQDSYFDLSELDSIRGNFKKALENYKMYINYRDSLFNEVSTKKEVQAEMNFEFDKKQAATKLEQEKKEAVAAAERRKQRIILLAISGFGILVLGFALFAYRSFLQKKKANIEISHQKRLIEEKQKEIVDSIYYARRIQRSLLPPEKIISKILTRLIKI